MLDLSELPDPIESDIDGIVNAVVTEVFCIVEYACHGTTPDDAVRGDLPSEATSRKIDRLADDLKERLMAFRE